MVVIICSKDNQKQAVKDLDLSGEPFEFVSPTQTGVNHLASRCVIVGSHPAIEKRYRGIMPVQTLELEEE